MEENIYRTRLPRVFELDDGSRVELGAEELASSREPLFLLYVPPELVDKAAEAMREAGLRPTRLRVNKGEKYSLVKSLGGPWELHVRLYPDGFVEAEVEVSRNYLEHLGGRMVKVVYEPYEYYRGVYPRLHIYYRPASRWVTRVVEDAEIELRPPRELLPWKPLVAAAGVAAALWVVERLARPKRGEA